MSIALVRHLSPSQQAEKLESWRLLRVPLPFLLGGDRDDEDIARDLRLRDLVAAQRYASLHDYGDASRAMELVDYGIGLRADELHGVARTSDGMDGLDLAAGSPAYARKRGSDEQPLLPSLSFLANRIVTRHGVEATNMRAMVQGLQGVGRVNVPHAADATRLARASRQAIAVDSLPADKVAAKLRDPLVNLEAQLPLTMPPTEVHLKPLQEVAGAVHDRLYATPPAVLAIGAPTLRSALHQALGPASMCVLGLGSAAWDHDPCVWQLLLEYYASLMPKDVNETLFKCMHLCRMVE